MNYKTKETLKNITIKDLPQELQDSLEDLKALTNNFSDEDQDDEILELDKAVANDLEPYVQKSDNSKGKGQKNQDKGQKTQKKQKSSSNSSKTQKQQKSSGSKSSRTKKGQASTGSNNGEGQKQQKSTGSNNNKTRKQQKTSVVKKGKSQSSKENKTNGQSSDLPNEYDKRLFKAQANTIEEMVRDYKNKKSGIKVIKSVRIGDEKCVILFVYNTFNLFPYKYRRVKENGTVVAEKKPRKQYKVIIPSHFFKDMYRTYQNKNKCGNAATALRYEGASEAGGYLGKYCVDIKGQKSMSETVMKEAHAKARKLREKKSMKYSKALSEALRQIRNKN